VILVGLWLTPFLLGHVGQRELGLWLVASQILGYLGLMDLGVLAILPREVAVASGHAGGLAPGGLIAQLVAQVRRIVSMQVVGLALCCAGVLWWLPSEWTDLRRPLIVVFAAFVVLYPLRIVVAVLQGLQELSFLAKTQFVGWAASSVVTIGLVLAGAGLHALMIGWVLATAVPAFAAWLQVRAKWPEVLKLRGAQPVGQYFKRSLWVSVSQIAQVLLNGSDVLVLGRLLGPAAVVPYACTGKLVTVFANHPQLLMHAAQPALSELRASESKQRLASVATALTQAMLMMSGALLVVILAANHFFVNWWVGPGQYGGWTLTVAFAGMMLLRHWNVATIYTLFCFGHERQISLTSLADGLLTVIGTALLVRRVGPIGAPIASMIAVLVVSLPMNLRSVALDMDLTVREFVRHIAPLVIRIVTIATMSAVAGALAPGDSLLTTVVLASSVGVLYLIVVIPIAWTGPVGPYIRHSVPAIERLLSPVTMSRPDSSPGIVERCRLAVARSLNG
jgi:O-antigen/teichoic acid export membrane protein